MDSLVGKLILPQHFLFFYRLFYDFIVLPSYLLMCYLIKLSFILNLYGEVSKYVDLSNCLRFEVVKPKLLNV